MAKTGSAGKNSPKADGLDRVGKIRKANLIEDTSDWVGVDLISVDVGTSKKPGRLKFNDYQYCTEGELHLAVLLDAHGVPFTPDVRFSLVLPGGKPRQFVPDFILNGRAWLWGSSGRRVELIHGFEVKGRVFGDDFSERAKENVRLLRERRGINIKLISDARVMALLVRWQRLQQRRSRHGRALPMVPLDLR